MGDNPAAMMFLICLAVGILALCMGGAERLSGKPFDERGGREETVDVRHIDGHELQELRITGEITRAKVMCPCGREVEIARHVAGKCAECGRKFTLCADQVGVRVFEPLPGEDGGAK